MSDTKLKLAILSLSLTTVMSGAAISPALGAIAKEFSFAPALLLKMIITLPAIMVILSSNFVFTKLVRQMHLKSVAVLGLFCFVLGGLGPAFVDNFYILLLFRAILGFGAGLLMPLSSSLIALLFPDNEQAKMMSLATLSVSIMVVITVSLSGILASISWHLSFFIYSIGLISLVLILLYLPKLRLDEKKVPFDKEDFFIILPYLLALSFYQIVFFNFTTNFSIVFSHIISFSTIGIIMSLNGICSSLGALMYERALLKLKQKIKYLGSFCFLIGFLFLSLELKKLELLCAILGTGFVGLGVGTCMPLFYSQISLKSKKINIPKNMALASTALFTGQFLSPIILDFFSHAFKIENIRAPFYVACSASLFLLFFMSVLKVSIVAKSGVK